MEAFLISPTIIIPLRRFPLTCVWFSLPCQPSRSRIAPVDWIGTGSATKDTNVPTKDLAMSEAHDDVDGILTLRPTCATIKHHKQLCPTLGAFSDTFRKQTDNSPQSHRVQYSSLVPLSRITGLALPSRFLHSPANPREWLQSSTKRLFNSQQRPQDNCPRPKARATITLHEQTGLLQHSSLPLPALP